MILLKYMELITLNGNFYSSYDIQPSKEYTYKELENILENIKPNDNNYPYFCILDILNNNKIIYTNLYEIPESKNKKFRLDKKFQIIFLTFLLSDIKKIAFKYTERDIFCRYKYITKPKQDKSLSEEFNLSDENLDSNKLFMLYLINCNPTFLSYAANNINSDLEVLHQAYCNGKYSLQYASDNLKNNKNFILHYEILEYASAELKNDESFILKYFLQHKVSSIIFPENIYFGKNIIDNKQFLIKLINNEISKFDNLDSYKGKVNSKFIKIFINNFIYDEEIALKYIKLQQLCKKFLQSYDYDYQLIKHLSPQLKLNKNIIKLCLEIDGTFYLDAGKLFENDLELIKISLSDKTFTDIDCYDEYENFLEYVDQDILRNKEIVIQAIRKNYNNYFYCSKILKKDIDVIKEAINNCYFKINDKEHLKLNAFKYINENIKEILEETNLHNQEIADAIIKKLNEYIDLI